MRKIFTIAAAMLLGASAFTANAAPRVSASGPTAAGVITVNYSGIYEITSGMDADNGTLYAYLTSDVASNIEIPFKYGDTANNKVTFGSSSLTINLKDLITFNGNYTLVIPAGYVEYTETSSYNWKSDTPEFTYTFTWSLGVDKTEDTFLPEISINDNVINITFSNNPTLTAANTTGAKVESSNGQTTIDLTYATEGGSSPYIMIDNGTTLKINFDPGLTLANGTYTLTIPAGFVTFNDGSTSNEAISQSFNYAIFDPGEVEVTLPTNLNGFVLQLLWPTVRNIIKSPDFTSVDGGVTINGVEVPESNVNVSGNMVDIKVKDVAGLVSGTNTLKVAAGYLTLTDNNYKTGSNGDLIEQFQYSGPAPADYKINFVFQAASGLDIANPGELVSVVYYDASVYQEKSVEITDNQGSANVYPSTTFTLTPTAGYIISNITASVDGVATISENDDEEAEWMVAVAEDPAAKEATFTVELAQTRPSVTLNFTSTSGEFYSNEYTFVTFDPSSVSVKDNNGNKVYIPTEGLNFSVSPVVGYKIEGVTVLNGSTNVSFDQLSNYDSSIAEANGVYTFNLSTKAAGLSFTFTIAEGEAGPGIEFVYESEGLQVGAYTCVTVMKDATVAVDVNDNNYIYTLPLNTETVSFTFTPNSGYSISVTSTTKEGTPFGTVTAEADGAYSVALPGDSGSSIPEEGVTITIQVTENASGVNSLNAIEEGAEIYSIQGLKVNKANLTNGLYIINGQKVYIKK